jgi:crotonobetainyl-CoA:carnitine CoA-transferase CaiB-like acyl-CoA transferase
MTQTEGGRGPLAGYKIIEVGTMVAGPFVGQFLADLGADVIKIEMLGGDPLRQSLPVHRGRGSVFENFNRGKRSLSVDVKSPEGLAIVRRLIRDADVFFENARPGVMDKLGLGYQDVRPLNQDIVYLSVNGFGASGPYARQPTYDVVVQGLTGFMYTQKGDNEAPAHIKAGIVDKIAAVYGALAIMAALLNRDPASRGQHLNVNMLNAYSAFMLPEVMTRFIFQEMDPAKRVNVSAGIFHNMVTSDGYATGFIIQRKEFEAAIRAFDRQDLIDDERFATSTLLVRHQDQLFEELSKVTRHMTRAEFMVKVLEEQLPLAPVNDMDDFFDDPQVIHNRAYVDFESDDAGPIRTLGAFADFDKTPLDVERLAPQIGEHSDAILRELGMADSEIASLRSANVVR